VNRRQRRRFDALLEQVLGALPPPLHELIERVPVIVEDRPAPDVLRELGIDAADADELCGLHSGRALTERSFEHEPELPEHIHLFREGIVVQAGGWLDDGEDEEGRPVGGDEAIEDEIRITLLHEMGHHFGLEEDDLLDLGYG
jgi:predicted Zn-dependent protease with MMP-like domain